MRVDGSAQFIPQEIIRNILKRLAAKSLKKFQCVCKQWENLFMAPAFIADHLHHFNHHSPSLLFQRSGRDKGVAVELCLLDCEKQLHEVQNITFHNRFPVRIVGSSNGFLCVEHYSSQVHSLYLWNPAIRKIRQVHSNVFSFGGSIYVGYGFSPIANDCKILRAYVPKYEYGDKDVVNEVKVYSLRTLKWNTIKCENLKGINLKSETVTANGAMFWLGSKLDDEEDFVVSFDIAMDAFTLIPMPPLYKSHKHSGHKLAVYENKLAVISHFVETVSCTTDSWSIDLWVMGEGITPQERWSWTKKYSLNTITGLEHPLGILRINTLCIWRDELVCNGDVIPGIVSKTESEGEIEVNEMFGIFGGTQPEVNILSYVSSILFLVNVRTNEMRKIATGRFDNEFSVIFNHFESLVPVDSDHIHRYTKPNLVTSP